MTYKFQSYIYVDIHLDRERDLLTLFDDVWKLAQTE